MLDNFEHVLAAARFVSELLDRLPGADRARDEPRAAGAGRRAALPGGAAGAARATTAGRRGAAPGARRRAVLRARASPRSRLPPRRRQRRRGRGDLPARRRAAAGDRAGGRALRAARRPARSPSAWTRRSARWAPARATRPRASGRCARRSTGATSCSATTRRQCFARFAVFAGGATVEAAETITGADPRHARRPGRQEPARAAASTRRTPTRLAMLETIRAYATERFATAADAGRGPRAPLPLLPRAGPAPRKRPRALGRRPPGAPGAARRRDRQPSRRPWLGGRAGRAEPALAMCAALGRYWLMRDRYADAVDWIDRALSLPGAEAHPALRVRALCDKAWCLWPLGRGAERPAVMAEAEAIARALGDPVAPLARPPDPRPATSPPPAGSTSPRRSLTRRFTGRSAAGDDWAIAMAAEVRALAAGSAGRRATCTRPECSVASITIRCP